MDENSTAPDQRTLTRGWQGVLGRLQMEMNPVNFQTWLKGTRALRVEDATLVVEARSTMTCDWLNQRLRVVVERAAVQSFPSVGSVRFVPPGDATAVQPQPEPATPRTGTAAAPVVGAVVGAVNGEFTFEGYVPGAGNAMAFESCLALVEPSDLRVSPISLFGGPGMGKTHLLHAVAARAREAGQRVACLNADEFANRFLTALPAGRVDEFKATVRSVDLLIIDDLQAIEGKKATLTELVHTMEAVMNSGGAIVVASDRSPLELALPDRLQTRLASGLITRVEPFLPEEQQRFVECVARRHRTALPNWAITRIANAPAGSVSALLGYVRGALRLERSGRLDVATLDAHIAGVTVTVTEGANAQGARTALLKRVSLYFNVAAEDLCGRARTRRVTDGRAVAAAALQEAGASLPEIAHIFDGRDPSTIHGLCARGRKLISSDPALRAALSLSA